MNIKKLVQNFDYLLFFTTIVLTLFGILFIYSANLNKQAYLRTEYLKQILFAITSLMILIALLFLEPRNLKSFAEVFYVVCFIGLFVTLFFPSVKGQRRFSLFGISIQFSEFLKVATILFLSKFYINHQNEIKTFRTYLIGCGIVMAAIAAVIIQPDLGSALVFIPILFGISFVAGVKLRYLFYTFGFFSAVIFVPIVTTINHLFYQNENELIYLITNEKYILIVFSFFVITITIAVLAYFDVIKGISDKFKTVFYWYVFFASFLFLGLIFSYPINQYVLKEYQKDRLLIFFNPYVDPMNKGYNIIQSMTTIGNGGVMGKGWKQGEMIQNMFLPEQATDFIFPVIAEELGFLGSSLLLVLYGLFFFRGFSIAYKAKDPWSTYVAVGILCMLLFHILENIGMTIGIMPITGIPLPFISYGGSFLIVCFVSVAILLNIKINRIPH